MSELLCENHPAFIRLYDSYMHWAEKKCSYMSPVERHKYVIRLIGRKHSDYVMNLEAQLHSQKYRRERMIANRDSEFYGGSELVQLSDAKSGDKYKFISTTTNKEMLLECIEHRYYKRRGRQKGYYERVLFNITTREKTYHGLMAGEAVLITDEEYNSLKVEFEKYQSKK
jgi:hypothetical protein